MEVLCGVGFFLPVQLSEIHPARRRAAFLALIGVQKEAVSERLPV